jgi:chemotaxis protein MotA
MRPDFLTPVGLVLGFGLLAYGIAIAPGATLKMFWDPPSVYITGGGTLCAILIQFPWRELRRLPAVLKKAFFYRPYSALKLIGDFRRFADIARRDGILALENVTAEIDDPFLVRGIQLAVDGTDPEVIHTMLSTEVDQMITRHNSGIDIIKKFAEYAPAFGMIGTLIGLVIMLQNLNDPGSIGPAMAVAIITTFYGALIAFLTAGPLSVKLESRSNEELLIREMMIKGVMSIQSGDNPRIVEQKLKIFLPPALRDQVPASS